MSQEKNTKTNKILTIVGTVLCVILIPILIINVTLIVKSYVNKDEVPNIGGITPLIVLTDSMFPKIEKGDLIICEKITAEDVKVGDVISFFDPAGNGTSIVTHRVIEIKEEDGKLLFVTKGDYNNIEDKDPVPGDKLVGLYTGTRVVGAGHVAMFMQSTAGLIICVVLPIVLLVGYDIIRRRIYDKKKSDDNEALLAELEELRALKELKMSRDALEALPQDEAGAEKTEDTSAEQ